MGTWISSELEKVKSARKRSGTPFQLYRCQHKSALLTATSPHGHWLRTNLFECHLQVLAIGVKFIYTFGFSLGIIFFEMCYRQLDTQMERDMIIGNIRRPEIILPDDFPTEFTRQVRFIFSVSPWQSRCQECCRNWPSESLTQCFQESIARRPFPCIHMPHGEGNCHFLNVIAC